MNWPCAVCTNLITWYELLLAVREEQKLKPLEFIIRSWNDGKDAAWIAKRLEHRYPSALKTLTEEIVKLYQGAEEFPGFPIMRKEVDRDA